MKFSTVFVASAAVAALSIESAYGYAKYLDQLPNGSSFAKALGHTDAGYTDFGNAFAKGGSAWSAAFCKTTYPGTTMSVGAAFGDPCCTWAVGGKADKTVTAWTDKPTTATVCASAATTAPPAATPAATKAPAVPDTPTATTAAPGKPSAPATTAPGKPSGPVAPATTAPGKPSGPVVPNTPTTAPGGGSGKPSKCGVKKENKSLDDDSEEIQYNDDNEDNNDDGEVETYDH